MGFLGSSIHNHHQCSIHDQHMYGKQKNVNIYKIRIQISFKALWHEFPVIQKKPSFALISTELKRRAKVKLNLIQFMFYNV